MIHSIYCKLSPNIAVLQRFDDLKSLSLRKPVLRPIQSNLGEIATENIRHRKKKKIFNIRVTRLFLDCI